MRRSPLRIDLPTESARAIAWVLLLIAFAAAGAIDVQKGEVSVLRGATWRGDYMFAPGDSVLIDASFARKGGSSWGCLALPFAPLESDDIGAVTFSQWEGPVIEQYFSKRSVSIRYFVSGGGPFSLVFKNSSSHRAKVVNLSIARVPTDARYLGFNTAFRADTLYDTTWTTETRQRLIRTDIVAETTWKTRTTRELVRIDTTIEKVVDDEYHLPAGGFELVNFQIPYGVNSWAYWIGLRECYSAMKQAMARVSGDGAELVFAANPVAGLALGVFSSLLGNDDVTDHDIRYDLQAFSSGGLQIVDLGGRVKSAHRRKSEGTGTKYVFKLDNTYSLLTAKNVHVEVAYVKLDEVYQEHQNNYPVVTKRSSPIYEPYEVQVPIVKSRVIPRSVRR